MTRNGPVSSIPGAFCRTRLGRNQGRTPSSCGFTPPGRSRQAWGDLRNTPPVDGQLALASSASATKSQLLNLSVEVRDLVRAHFTPRAVTYGSGRGWQLSYEVAIEIEGVQKPALAVLCAQADCVYNTHHAERRPYPRIGKGGLGLEAGPGFAPCVRSSSTTRHRRCAAPQTGIRCWPCRRDP